MKKRRSISRRLADNVSRARRGARRGAKRLSQAVRRTDGEASPVFVIGCQRSGTNMLMAVLDRSPDTWLYNEYNKTAFDRLRLKDDDRIRRLVARARCRSVIFKPLCDSQHADRLLEAFPDSKAIWIYRSFMPVAESAVREWGSGQRKVVARALADDHWIGERVPEERRAIVRQLLDRGLSDLSAAALKWWLRNEIYFDRRLHDSDRVLLVRYEDLVADPRNRSDSLFRWTGLEFDPAYTELVRADRGDAASSQTVDPGVRELCEELMARFERVDENLRARSE